MAITDSPLSIPHDYWESPIIPLAPSAWYRLRYRARCEGSAYWALRFFDGSGTELPDFYDGIEACPEMLPAAGYFRTKNGTASGSLRFQCLEHPLEVADAAIDRVDSAEVLEWADRMSAGIPPVALTPDSRRWERLAQTRRAFENRRPVRCVMVGDSIMNDVHNSPWDLLLAREYGYPCVEVISGVRGSLGFRRVLDDGLAESLILAHRPDLVMLCARSSRVDPEGAGLLVSRLREADVPEVLLLTDPFGVDGDPRRTEPWDAPPNWPGDNGAAFARVAEETGAAFFDLHGEWVRYIGASNLPYERFLRDIHHAGARGRLVAAQMLCRFLKD